MDDLVRGLKAGDGRAFERLVRDEGDRVHRFILRLAGPAEADDLTQEVFLRVFRSIGAFDATAGSFRGWMFTIASNLSTDHLRRRRFQESPGEPLDARMPGPSAQLENRETHHALLQAVAALPGDQKQVFLLREEGGLSFREIADLLNIPLNTALGRMHYAMERLRKSLQAHRG